MRTLRRSRASRRSTGSTAPEGPNSGPENNTEDIPEDNTEDIPEDNPADSPSESSADGNGDADQRAELSRDNPGTRSSSSAQPPQGGRHPGQLRSLLMAAHPRTALAITAAVALLVALMGRPAREVLVSAAAVLVVQLLLGIMNDVFDREDDAASLARGKPIAAGWLPSGNATFAIAVLLLLALPVSLQNGTLAGVLLLATVPVGYLHNRWLHRTPLSWLGWSASFALLAFFVTFGGWGPDLQGTAPTTPFVVLSAALGFFVHFLTTLPDLVTDNRAKVRNLPLRVALRTGAAKLLVASVVCTVVVVGLLVWSALTTGIAR